MKDKRPIITMGFYQQQDLEWIVLTIENGRALLVSKEVIDCLPYHNRSLSVTWQDCWIRQWLNYRFFQEAFSVSERNRIRDTHLYTQENETYHTEGGTDTYDRIFLLSEQEVKQYMTVEVSQAQASVYARKQNVYTRKHKEIVKKDGIYQDVELEYAWWWLRTPGKVQSFARFINSYGRVHDQGRDVGSPRNGIRPAMWIAWTN